MTWNITRPLLSLTGEPGRLRNVGISLRTKRETNYYSYLYARLKVRFRVNGDGKDITSVRLLTPMPACKIEQLSPLTVKVTVKETENTKILIDFGDKTEQKSPLPTDAGEDPYALHTYNKPGKYVIELKCTFGAVYSEYRYCIVVDKEHVLGTPLQLYFDSTIVKITKEDVELKRESTEKGVTFTLKQTSDAGEKDIRWRFGNQTSNDTKVFTIDDIDAGDHVLELTAYRKLNVLINNNHRTNIPEKPYTLHAMSIATNRVYDKDGTYIIPKKQADNSYKPEAHNTLTNDIFSNLYIDPDDEWRLSIKPEQLMGGAASIDQLDLSDIEDAILAMEYEVLN